MSHTEKPRPSAAVASVAAASAVGGKTARPCDSCLRRRARWYCAADDAFLCQGCDSSVHSANPLARRHQRLRLKTASATTVPAAASPAEKTDGVGPTWHNRKARTPRGHHHHHHAKPVQVPELETSADDDENNTAEEEEEQLLYRVPIFDPILAELYSPPILEDEKPIGQLPSNGKGHPPSAGAVAVSTPTDGLAGLILPSDMELAEFAADMESLLGHNDSFSMEELGLVDSRAGDANCRLGNNTNPVKLEELDDDPGAAVNVDLDDEMLLSRETLDISFDCGSAEEAEEMQEDKSAVAVAAGGYRTEAAKRVGLRLDYEAVIASWSTKSCSPWTNGERPQFGPDDCWLDYMGMWGGGEMAGVVQLGEGGGGHVDGGREARVSRYREKRRTRLFSKKIRYEVRKLNAEKRPRMKGRFVKRASFAAAAGSTGGAAAFPY